MNTGAYIRLSVENNGKKENDSIEMQIKLIEDFIFKRQDLNLKKIYIDNGKSGTDFNRDAFCEMKNDILNKQISCIVVKDLSRFGRNFAETSQYIDIIFPFYNVRFISINDNYDSFNKKTNSDISIVFKNLMNSWYSDEISKKVSEVLKIKQEKGEYIGGLPPYGYIILDDDKHKLVPDINTCHIVKKIFDMRLNGMGYTQISRILNQEGIYSPYRYKYEKGWVKKERFKNILWQPASVKKILSNQIYTGDMVQRKSKAFLCNGRKRKNLDKSEWIVVSNTHTAIVEKELFYKIEAMADKKNYKKSVKVKNNKNVFSKILYCGSCKKKLYRYKSKYFLCRNHTIKGISESVLYNTITKVLKNQLYVIFEKNKIKVNKNYNANKIKAIKKYELLKLKSFEKFFKSEICKEDYVNLNNLYDEKLKSLKEFNLYDEYGKNKNYFIFNEKIAEDIIDRINVISDNRIEVHFKCSE